MASTVLLVRQVPLVSKALQVQTEPQDRTEPQELTAHKVRKAFKVLKVLKVRKVPQDSMVPMASVVQLAKPAQMVPMEPLGKTVQRVSRATLCLDEVLPAPLVMQVMTATKVNVVSMASKVHVDLLA